MGDIIDRLDELYKDRLEILSYHIPRLNTTQYDSDGGAKYDLFYDYRFLAVCEYILNKDKKKFLALLSKSADMVAKIFDEYQAGKITSITYVKCNQYFHMLDSYASSDFKSAKTIAKYIGHLDTDKKEKGFFPALSYSLKYLVLEDNKNLKLYSDKLNNFLTQKNAKNYLGYAKVIEAYVNQDTKEMQKSFETLLTNHKQLCKGRGEYSNTEDEVIFIYGLGLLNLVRSRGFDITLDDPLIPNDLIMNFK
jgi:hypothetical protein